MYIFNFFILKISKMDIKKKYLLFSCKYIKKKLARWISNWDTLVLLKTLNPKYLCLVKVGIFSSLLFIVSIHCLSRFLMIKIKKTKGRLIILKKLYRLYI